MLKILLVDDDRVTRDMLMNVLTKEGYECYQAENGQQAFLIFRENFPQVIVTDFRMPICDGQVLLNTVKTVSPETAVIILTGSADYGMIPIFKQQGALACLEKPLVLSELLTVLQRLVNQITMNEQEAQ
ncbi:MAG: response regulator [Candidatus Omnitrophica bacterium]|nr:response regulator [Candidatus Omnitrophota bacterium]